ncbi:uncharacterized protein LOC124419201 [Lucilia cuprina]|uniref:uncharacterized protein LOC124419201 n=1 Tax=Lucilia cuprina TaxID=7375 RepID=UPI001F062651|nr:uncharacterized protein LOC124419201 [Lucilia cuprina]
MLVMTFGAACSPCVAHYVKETNALCYRDQHPRAVKSILDHNYVDDFVDSFPNPARAIEIAQQVRNIHKAAGFELRNFSSNSSEVIVAPKCTVEKPVNFSIDFNELKTEKVLGMYWQPKADTFRFNLKFHNINAGVMEGVRSPTKRELLSVVMFVFDPLGFLTHFMITAKLMMREVWRHSIGWDETLRREIVDAWNNWRQGLQNVEKVKVRRCYFGNGVPYRLELHVFVHASEDAFGAVSYWRSLNAHNKIKVSLVAAKSRCAALKIVSIPRLELQAAILGTRLMVTILKEHSVKISRIICWSDSTTVINWIGSESRRADETTRMKSQVDFSDDSCWLNGPKFLYDSEDNWPQKENVSLNEPDSEELRLKFALLVNIQEVIDYKRFSSYLKLKRTVAWVLRFINRCRKEIGPGEENGLTADELKNAEILLCRQAQQENFCHEIEILKNEGSLPKSSELYALCPYMDENALLRVYGRVDAASWLPLDLRRPIILPSFHPVTEFRRTLPVPPKDRSTPYIRPFSYTGSDYFGPLTIMIGRRHEKRWVALFTCLTIRAIHLEVAFDLSTDACILTIRNFINRRGIPTRLRSDNGTNFVGADQVVKRFSEVFDVARIKDKCSTKGIDWQEWKRGRVEELFKGSGGITRRADVRSNTGVLRRPVSKLAILDLE